MPYKDPQKQKEARRRYYLKKKYNKVVGREISIIEKNYPKIIDGLKDHKNHIIPSYIIPKIFYRI